MSEFMDLQPADGIGLESPLGLYELVKEWEEDDDGKLQFAGWQLGRPQDDDMSELKEIGADDYQGVVMKLLRTYATDQ